MKSMMHLASAAAFALASAYGPVLAQDAAGAGAATTDVGTTAAETAGAGTDGGPAARFACRDLAALEGDRASDALHFLAGYGEGRSGAMGAGSTERDLSAGADAGGGTGQPDLAYGGDGAGAAEGGDGAAAGGGEGWEAPELADDGGEGGRIQGGDTAGADAGPIGSSGGEGGARGGAGGADFFEIDVAQAMRDCEGNPDRTVLEVLGGSAGGGTADGG